MEETFEIKMFRIVKEHMNWDDHMTHLWFGTPNPMLGQMEPHHFMKTKPDKFERWVTALINENSAPDA